MNVGELKEMINGLPDDMEVILQKDSEGNGYSPLYCTDSDCVYEADSSYSGTVYDMSWSAKDADMEEEDWEEMKKEPRVLVLCPTN